MIDSAVSVISIRRLSLSKPIPRYHSEYSITAELFSFDLETRANTSAVAECPAFDLNQAGCIEATDWRKKEQRFGIMEYWSDAESQA